MPKKEDVKQIAEFTLRKKSKNFFETLTFKKVLVILMFIVFILLLIFTIGYFINVFFGKSSEQVPACADGTFYETCSLRKPYFCSNGTLVEKASVCGCIKILTKKEDSCISKYQTNPKNITLKYVLRGEEKEIDYAVYGGMVDYLSGLPKSIYYREEEKPFRADFKLKNINEEEQRELLLPLVTKIQNIAKNKEDQARIAISIVQHIPYNKSEEIIVFGDNQAINYSRYPYEVLYDMQGVCEEKSELLAFLLREMGYSVVLFYYALENHEALGIKCPVEHSLNDTGYCFVEATEPSIITNDKNEYFIIGKLFSKPEVILISEGISLGDDLYEYTDAKFLININKIIEKKGKINFIRYWRLEKLREKYGLIDEYNA